MNIKTDKKGDKLTVILEGELDTQSAPELEGVFKAALPDINALDVDFKYCDYVSSAGLRVLLSTFQKLEARACPMKLLNVGGGFKDVLKITHMDEIFGVK